MNSVNWQNKLVTMNNTYAKPINVTGNPKNTQTNVLKYLMKPSGVALVTSIIIFLVLIIIQPSYVVLLDQNNKSSLNFPVIFFISIVCGIIIVLVPYSIKC
jgi:hypothetical protein